MSIEIESEDVIRLILQFLKENQFDETATTLQTETSVKIGHIENKDQFIKEIKQGEWDTVLRHVMDLKIPSQKVIDLYEHIILELVELRELGAARTLLRQTEPMFILKQRYPERYLRLEHTLSRTSLDPREIYPHGATKEKRRQVIAQALASEVTIAEPSRLMKLLNDSIKWQRQQRLLSTDTPIDLFQNPEQTQEIEADAFVNQSYATIKFPGKNTYAECTAFSPDGQYFATGSVDGFIEIWNHLTGKLRKDLRYQADENLMAMDQSVICLSFSLNSELLVSGSTDGKIAIWRVQNGFCQRKYTPAHSQGVTSVRFNKDASEILSCSYDHSVKIHSVKSGKLIREFKGHRAFVNSVIYSADYTRVISASSDGEVRIWDISSGGSISCFPQDNLTIHALLTISEDSTHLVMVNKSNRLHILDSQGKITKSFGHSQAKDFVAAATSHNGTLIYAVSEESIMYCFDVQTEALVGQ
ncbi:Serine/threonine-protein kinase smu1, partial [Rhizopus azygosporus]